MYTDLICNFSFTRLLTWFGQEVNLTFGRRKSCTDVLRGFNPTLNELQRLYTLDVIFLCLFKDAFKGVEVAEENHEKPERI
jgi:hypothetical protein